MADLRVEGGSLDEVSGRLHRAASAFEDVAAAAERGVDTAVAVVSHQGVVAGLDEVLGRAKKVHRSVFAGLGKLGDFAQDSSGTYAETDSGLAAKVVG